MGAGVREERVIYFFGVFVLSRLEVGGWERGSGDQREVNERKAEAMEEAVMKERMIGWRD